MPSFSIQGMGKGRKKPRWTQIGYGGTLADAAPVIEPHPWPEPVPTASDAKPVIIAWLLAVGVGLSEPALSLLTKAELLEMVADIINNDEEPA